MVFFFSEYLHDCKCDIDFIQQYNKHDFNIVLIFKHIIVWFCSILPMKIATAKLLCIYEQHISQNWCDSFEINYIN